MNVDLAALRSEVKAGQQALREAYALTNDAHSHAPVALPAG